MEEMLRDSGLAISRADVAHLMLGVLERPDTIGRVIGIACWRRVAPAIEPGGPCP